MRECLFKLSVPNCKKKHANKQVNKQKGEQNQVLIHETYYKCELHFFPFPYQTGAEAQNIKIHGLARREASQHTVVGTLGFRKQGRD